MPVQYTPNHILDLALTPGAVHIILGPRQVGKSTAVKLLIRKLLVKHQVEPEHIFYFNCDVLEGRQDVVALVTAFFDGLVSGNGKVFPTYIFLDEISSVVDWPYAIKWLVDAGVFAQARVFLTGSSSIRLKRSGELMPGRRGGGKDVVYWPVSFREYVRAMYPAWEWKPASCYAALEVLQRDAVRNRINMNRLIQEFSVSGGFLKIINLMAQKFALTDALELYRSALRSELAKAGRKEVSARGVLRKIIASVTAETSYTSIAEEAELGSKNTAVEYLNFFRDSLLLNEVMFYDIDQRRILLKKNKKFYPSDPFLLHLFNAVIAGADTIEPFVHQYSTSPLDSHFAEVFVQSELTKAGMETFYFRRAKEIDFYLPQLDVGIEVKYKNRVTGSDLRTIKTLPQCIVVSKNTLAMRYDTLIVPLSLFPFVHLQQFVWGK